MTCGNSHLRKDSAPGSKAHQMHLLVIVLLSVAVCHAAYLDKAIGWSNAHCATCTAATDCQKYVADCAHFAIQSVIAGGCGPDGVEIMSPVYTYTHYKNKYDLAWVDSARGLVYDGIPSCDITH